MKILLVLLIVVKISSLPINDLIIFPDDEEVHPGDFSAISLADLFNDKNIVKSENLTIEFLNEEKNIQSRSLFDVESRGQIDGKTFFQGDIILLDEQKDFFINSDNSTAADSDDDYGTRTGVIHNSFRWPKNINGRVIIPFEIAGKNFSSLDIKRIYAAIYDIRQHTCIDFQPRTDAKDYVYIYRGDNCYSYLGRVGGRQLLSLSTNCMEHGVILHELIHVIGYTHMHNHVDRDSYVTIYWRNIKLSEYSNFKRVNPRVYSNFGTPYDYYSVMHYGMKDFSWNGLYTIVPKYNQYRKVIGQKHVLSVGDVKRINTMYNCY